MPITVTHTFNSSIADSPAAIILGKVTPSRWDGPGAHTIGGAVAANEVTNIPTSPITSTDVQAALNQLASLIPIPGAGTDPLSLVNGLSVNTVNPVIGPASERYAAIFSDTTDCSQTNPGFCNNEIISTNMRATNGQNTNGGATTAKQTFLNQINTSICNAAGQKNISYDTIASYGMGDTSIGQKYVQYAGGPVNGDEGQGFQLVSTIRQQNFLTTATITSVPAPSAVNTTTTQPIVQSKSVQTVNVVNTAGAVIGDWVIVEQQIPSGSPNLEAVQIQNFTANSITGVFYYNHPNGVTITPALRLVVNNPSIMGQDRVLINLSKPSYSTGNILSATGFGLNGNATGWTTNMVGGNALNVGAISLTADDYSQGQFSFGNTLKSWYQITQVTSPTRVEIFAFSTVGPAGYVGAPIGAGLYTIRQAARVLRIVTTGGSYTGEIICETSTSTWSVGDNVEQAICPYATVNGYQYNTEHFTRGGGGFDTFYSIVNIGPRKINAGFAFANFAASDLPFGDGVSFGTLINSTATCNVGIHLDFVQGMALQLQYSAQGGGRLDAGGAINWGTGTAASIVPNSTNLGMTFKTLLVATATEGVLTFANANTGINTDLTRAMMQWAGFIYMPVIAGKTMFLRLDNVTDAVNYERAFFRWTSNVLEIGTEKGGGGTAEPVHILTDGIARLSIDPSNALTSFPNAGFGLSTPVTKNNDFTLSNTDNWLINNKAGSTCVIHMVPMPAGSEGREVKIVNYQNQAVEAHVPCVVPLGGGAAGVSILAATVGKWAKLVWDGSNWIIMQAN